MTFATYNLNIPAAPNNPSADQPLMQTNTNSIASLIAIDHIGFSTTNGGYHTVIHQGNTGTFPTPPGSISGIGQTFVQTVGSDQQLFYESGGGVVTQLTGPNAAVASNFGYTWIGGILFQWGYITLPGSSNPNGTVTFATSNISFPNNCFNVQLSLNANSDTSQSNTASTIGTPSKTSFKWNFTGSTSYNYIYWLAIGN